MNGARVDRLIIADSTPAIHDAVNDVQRRGPMDLMRFPGLAQILAGSCGSVELRELMLQQVALCRELHGVSKIVVVATDRTDYNLAVSRIDCHLRKRLQFERVICGSKDTSAEPSRCVVTCVDYREPFVKERNTLRQPNCHEVAIPGAVKRLSEGGPIAAHLIPWLRTNDLTVEVLQHEDCGAYGPELHADSPEELAQHSADVTRFATLAEMQGVRFAGGRLIRLDGTTQRF